MREVVLPQPVLFVIYLLHEAGFDGYVVGGAVRDLLMKRSVTDWDFTTNATPEEIQKLFPNHFYDNDFGTVGIAFGHLAELMRVKGWRLATEIGDDPQWREQVFEITTYRKESGYSDRRRPDTIVWGKTLDEDLSRRDFSVNAMALSLGDPAGYRPDRQPPLNGLEVAARMSAELETSVTLVDPFRGQANLISRLIRAVGSAEERFEEDALRMMRAIRFGAQLGFLIESQTLQAILKHAQLIDHISWERKRDEFLKTLASDFPADGVMLLYTSGLLAYLIPEMLEMREVQQGGHHIYDVWMHSLESLRHCPSTDPIVRLATLLHDIGKPATMRKEGPRGVTFYGHKVVGARMAKQIGRRLRLSNKEIDRLWTLVRWHMFVYESDMTDAAIRRFIRRVGLENINDMMLLRVGDRKGGGSKATSWRLRELQQRIGEQLYEPMGVKDLKVGGNDVMQVLQIEPGPVIGKILNQLFEEVMEDTTQNEREVLLKRVEELGKTV